MKQGVVGKRGVVSSPHPLATRAGIDALKKGGNAVDAALAAALTLGAVAPQWSGLGGGGFALIHLSGSDETSAVDYREVASENAHPDMFELDSAGHVEGHSNAIGPLAIAVPGAASGLATMLEKYAKLKLRDIAEFARKHATRGSPTGLTLHLIMKENRDDCLEKFRSFRSTGRIFLKRGKPLGVKDVFLIPKLHETLNTIIREEPSTFYGGRIGEKIVSYLKKSGGILTREDFRQYRPKMRTPFRGTYRDFEICGLPPPSSGGLTIIEILNILEKFDLAKTKHNRPETIHLMAEAMKLAYADRATKIGDPDFVSVPTAELASKEYADRLHSLIRIDKSIRETTAPSYEGSGTSHVSVLDKEGNAVALTESIECYFGSGVLVPEVGILMNDEMHDFDPTPGRSNSIQPRKRPMSSMAPTILFKDGRPSLVLGSAGGPRIISSVLQTIVNMVDFRMALQEAVAAPRFHCQGGRIVCEASIDPRTQNSLQRLGHKVQTRNAADLFFGGVHAIAFDHAHRSYTGTADPRRDGIALAI